MDGPWFFYLVLAAIPGVIVAGAIWIQIQAAQTARWPSVPGRVVASRAEAREVEIGGPDVRDSEQRNFAKIVYEYTVAGRTYRCSRVGLGEDAGNVEVAATLARYPVGKAVTVYYNPSKRSDAILERTVPAFVWKGLAVFVALYAAIVLGSIVGFTRLGTFMATVVGDPARAPFVTACIGFSLFAGLVVYAVQRNVARMRLWPKAPGRIVSAQVRSFQARESGGGRRRWSTRYRPEITYVYEVGGVPYTGNQVGTTARVGSNIEALTRPGARYAPGAVVEVHHDPDNPAESILDPRTGPLWLLWLIPAALLALAFVVGR